MVRKLVSLMLVMVIALLFTAGCKDDSQGLPETESEIKAAAEDAGEAAEEAGEDLENEIDKLADEIDSETTE
ncbi:hypothetical protein SMSP2_01672 [Limihaloglobus sulfuriphilus]|uniref:Uncharacterized protein n=1 Tax=Limihaloglobus sulfuriphilus TaxID=1851148 RepID=A0A1Q2MF22_9BACT|nr:hypothetical protein [Limihaloglobus sulfuriphilus]AQQ71301.1 hypothetical protein SMSP2_01672 [Limihaloglobus sulfuriphilus]